MEDKVQRFLNPRNCPDLAQHAELFGHFDLKIISQEDNILNVALQEPYNYTMLEQIEFLTGFTLRPQPLHLSSEMSQALLIDSPGFNQKSDDIANVEVSTPTRADTLIQQTEETATAHPLSEHDPVPQSPVVEAEKIIELTTANLSEFNKTAVTKTKVLVPRNESLARLTKSTHAAAHAKSPANYYKETIKALCSHGFESGLLYVGSANKLNPIAQWQIAGKQSMFYRTTGLDSIYQEKIDELVWELEDSEWHVVARKEKQPHSCAQYFVSLFKDYETIAYFSQQKGTVQLLYVCASQAKFAQELPLKSLQELLSVKNTIIQNNL